MKAMRKFSKRDFREMYDNVEMEVFEEWIKDIIDDIGWVKGKKQVFPPVVAKKIFDHLGLPLNIKLDEP